MAYYDLGAFGWPVTTQNSEAQLWFDRGMAWCYGYNHEEAIVCFERALERDPGCAMAHWGIAYAIGPNYNKPWEAFDDDEKSHSLERALEASAAAVDAADGASDIERALISALAKRYPSSPDRRGLRTSGTTPTQTPCGPSTGPTAATSTFARCSRRPS